MTVLTTTREAVAAALTTAGLTSYAYVPDQFGPPGAFVLPGDPYVEEADTFGNKYVVRFVVTAVTPRAANDLALVELDNLIMTVMNALADWDLERVTPGSDRNNPEQLVTEFTISKTITL